MSSVPRNVAGGTASLVDEAERLWKDGALQPAYEKYRSAVAAILNSSEPLTSADIVALERFADRAVTLGQTAAAEEALSAMADLCRDAGNAYGEDYAVLKAVIALHQGGDVRRALLLLYSLRERFGNIDAIEFTPEVLPEWEKTVRWPDTDEDDRAVLLALFYLAASRLASSLGQYADATQAARRGAVHAQRNTPLARRYRVPLMLAEALAAVQSGELDDAAVVLRDANAEMDPKRDPGFHFESLELSAKLAILRGDLGAALEKLTASVDLAKQWPDRRVAAVCLENLADFQILLNQTAQAKATLDQAAECGGNGRVAQLRAMADLRARSYSEDYSRSVTEIWDAAPAAAPDEDSATDAVGGGESQPADFLMWFEQRSLALQLALAERRPRDAGELLDAMHRSFGATSSELVQLRMGFLDALLAYYRGDLPEADRTLRAVLPRLQRIGLLHDLWQARRLAGWIAKRSRASLAIEIAREKENETLMALASSLDPVSRAIFLLNKWTEQEEQLAQLADRALQEQGKPRSRFAPLRWWRTLRTWRGILAFENRLEAEKRALAAVASGASAQQARPLGLLDVWRHPAGEATVTFSALPDRLFAVSRTRRGATIDSLPVSRIDLRDAVKSWHQRMLAPGGMRRKRADALSAHLARVLERMPAGIERLRVRPDDALHGYPFAALALHSGYAIERFEILMGQGHRTTSNPRSPEAAVLAVTDRVAGYADLPGVAEEAEAIGALLPPLGFALRRNAAQSARKSEAVAALGSASLVHIACHGRFCPDRPADTGLIFAGLEGQPETLSIAGIGALNCSGLKHVTLSACWSADNYVAPGRWVFSLPETFCRAGAGSVLASLWEVNDQVAGAFMKRFYSNAAGATVAAALRDVQLACLRNQLCAMDTSDPVNWAGYHLFGEDGSLRCR